MKALITGGAGFIGSYVAQALVVEDNEVVIVDDFNDDLYPSSLKRARLEYVVTDKTKLRVIEASIVDESRIRDILHQEKPELVLHFAAMANPGASFGREGHYTNINVLGTVQVLRACTQADVKYFIFAGSSSIYDDQRTPFQESDSQLKPRSAYGASKAAAEVYCRLWHEQYSLPMTILRFFSVYGPWGRPDMAPHIFAERILRQQPIAVTAEPRLRDFTYITDVVDGIMAVARKRPSYEVINLGRGEPTNLRDLIQALETAAGVTAQITSRPAPPGEMRITYADTTKARDLLGYEPKVSVPQGAAQVVAWMKDWYVPHH